MALEISVWEDLGSISGQKQTSVTQQQQQQQVTLLGETVIPLESAIYSSSSKSEWWPLLSVPSFNQQQINAPNKTANVNTTSSNFASIAQPNKQLLTTNQLQDRCVSAEYLCKCTMERKYISVSFFIFFLSFFIFFYHLLSFFIIFYHFLSFF